MATSLASDFVVYPEIVSTAIVETLTQASNGFNAASNGAIRLSTLSQRGHYASKALFDNIASLVTRRDITSVSAATGLKPTMDEFISVKLNRKVGPIESTLDAFRKAAVGRSAEEMNVLFGEMIAKAMQVDMMNSAVRAAVAALDNVAASTFTVASSGTLNSDALIDGLNLMGDAADRVVCWVAHSKPMFNLLKSQVALNIDGVSGALLLGASPATFNRPMIVTDSTALTGGSPTDYYTLGLVRDGIVVESSEEETFHGEIVSGLEQLVYRLQGEFAYNLGVKGFKWDTTNGGNNPADAAVATGTNWDVASVDYKDRAGIVIQSR